MKITNKQGLPETLVRAVQSHTHRGADYSATQLLKSPRQLWLERRHDENIEVDASDKIFSLMGTAVHYVAQVGEADHQFSETYMEEEIDGVTVSGTADLYDPETHTITDFKNTSVYTIIYDSRRDEWEKQLNVYAWLMRKAGFQVEQLEIIAILRDWQKTKANFDPNYPDSQVVVVKVNLWGEDDAEWYIRNRVELFESHRDTPDNELPLCTPEERWESETKYAVMKHGRKSAVKLYTDLNDAENHATQLGPNHYVEIREGTPRRCIDYCPAAPFCNQFQREAHKWNS